MRFVGALMKEPKDCSPWALLSVVGRLVVGLWAAGGEGGEECGDVGEGKVARRGGKVGDWILCCESWCEGGKVGEGDHSKRKGNISLGAGLAIRGTGGDGVT